MNVDAELLASVRAEYDCLREDLRHIERGDWRGVTPTEMQLVRHQMQRLALLVVLNDVPASTTH